MYSRRCVNFDGNMTINKVERKKNYPYDIKKNNKQITKYL